MTGPVFVDTNVLVYLHDATEPAKQARAAEWIAFLARRREARISVQVLQELYAVFARKLDRGVDAEEAREIVRDLAAWNPVAIDVAMLERAWLLERRYGISWWDALILAAAQACGCRTLLTEDLQHG